MVRMVSASADSGDIIGAIVEAVADETGVAQTDVLSPLYGTVDPDALDALVGSRAGDDLRVRFRYHGCTVTVDGTGRVTATCGTS